MHPSRLVFGKVQVSESGAGAKGGSAGRCPKEAGGPCGPWLGTLRVALVALVAALPHPV